jgi:cytochrome c-type biogenesis protein CcmH/NrfG
MTTGASFLFALKRSSFILPDVMSKENVVFTACGFLLGLILGSMVIGPKLAQSKVAAASMSPDSQISPAPQAAGEAPPAGPGSMEGMAAVQKQIDGLKATIAREPSNVAALLQLGNMYMDVSKWPQAIDYFERALKVREQAEVRTDLAICYRNSGQMEKSLESFRRVSAAQPNDFQAAFNEAAILTEMKRFDEARPLIARLEGERPGDAEVGKLKAAVGGP